MQKPTRKFLIVLSWVAVAVVLIQMVGTFLKVRKAHQPMLGGLKTISTNDTLQVKMQKFAEEAVNIAHRYDVQMDFSVESLEKIDQQLDLLSASYRAGKVKEADMGAGCLIWGAYVGEVIRKHHGGGEWSEGPDGTGHGTYPLIVRNETLYPCRWCVERVQNGNSVSVWKQYQVFAFADAMRKADPVARPRSPTNSQ